LKKERKKTANPIRIPKSNEVRYRRQLQALALRLIRDVRSKVIPVLKQYETEYVNDAYATVLEEVFDALRREYNDVAKTAKNVSQQFVDGVNRTNRQRFYTSMEQAVGLNLQNIIQDEDLNDILRATTRENVNLINSIPDEYLKNIESIVFTGTTRGTKFGSMMTQIAKAGRVSNNKAKLIARDQTTKLNSALNQQRQQNLGIEEYVWITAQDGDRVRESHRKNHGKTFRWDRPPKETGHPGNDINCRCVAKPIIKLENL